MLNKKMTKKEYLEYWNKNNPSQRATIDQVNVCGCGYPACKGWYIEKKDEHKTSNYK